MKSAKAYWSEMFKTDPDLFAAMQAEYKSSPKGKACQKACAKRWYMNNKEAWNKYQREYKRRKRTEQQTAILA